MGYDLVERVSRDSKSLFSLSVIGMVTPRSLRCGQVLVKGKRAKVLSRVSMDMIVVDVTGIACRFGDVATLIGRDSRDKLPLKNLLLPPAPLITKSLPASTLL